MDKKYIDLFTNLAHQLELTSERVIEDKKGDEDPEALRSAIAMRSNFMSIYDKLRKQKEDAKLTIVDFAHLYIAAGILINQLREQKETIETAIRGYNIDVIPKLNRVLTETHNDEDAMKLASELFMVNESTSD